MRSATLALALVAVTAALAAPARSAGKPGVAALQVALYGKRVYQGSVDGVLGPRTRAAVRRFQRRAGLTVDGVVGPHTRRALGRLGRPKIGDRVLHAGAVGWDVAALQFALAWHGFASGIFDGVFGPRAEAAVRGLQRFAGIAPDGVVGPVTLRALRRPLPASPLRLAWPVRAEVSSGFGPRGDRFHEGVDLAASFGTRVRAAAAGRVVFAGWNDGFGKLVIVRHRARVTTFYAHLSRISIGVGRRVGTGTTLGRVGSTGRSTGPHLHFEVHFRGAAVDPLGALG